MDLKRPAAFLRQSSCKCKRVSGLESDWERPSCFVSCWHHFQTTASRRVYSRRSPIFTKDPLIIDVDGVVYYRVQNAPLAVTKVTNADSATHLLAKAIMKNTLGAQNLCHIISERDKVAKDIQALLDNVTGDWGVKIERVEIKNVKTRVNVVAPRNMMPQPKPVKEASILLQESPLSLQLHYLKADGAHSGQPNSTIIFSYP
ncbi:stomatin-like isoform 13-T15 [Liasis olivaceus]